MAKGKPAKWTMEALNPYGSNDPLEVWLPQAHVDGLTRKGLETRFARLLLVPEVLKNPEVVFQGLEREGQEEGLCYVGRPSRDFHSTTIEVPAPPGKVFLVFVERGGKVFEWRWEPSEDDEPAYPENYRERFGRVLWPTNQPL